MAKLSELKGNIIIEAPVSDWLPGYSVMGGVYGDEGVVWNQLANILAQCEGIDYVELGLADKRANELLNFGDYKNTSFPEIINENAKEILKLEQEIAALTDKLTKLKDGA